MQTGRVYAEPGVTPAVQEPNVVVEQCEKRNTASDFVLADNIRDQMGSDRGLAPSLQGVTIAVCDGQVTLRGAVKSDMDARVVADDLRDVPGVSRLKNELEINPD